MQRLWAQDGKAVKMNKKTTAQGQPTTAKPTPGPWRFDGTWITDSEDTLDIAAIMRANVLFDSERRANALLIAAAPELLEALGNLITYLTEPSAERCPICLIRLTSDESIPHGKGCELAAARAAIAKATGGQP